MKKTKLVSELTAGLHQEFRINSHVRNMKIRLEWCDGAIHIFGKVKKFFQKQIIFSLIRRKSSQVEIQDYVTVE